MKATFEMAEKALAGATRVVREAKRDGSYINWMSEDKQTIASGFIGDSHQFSSPRSNMTIRLPECEDTHFDGVEADILGQLGQ